MMLIKLDVSRGAPPLYLQVADALESHIRESGFEPGTKLPSEPKLASTNKLSRATVLKAFELLVERGLVSRHQGRGTFVRSRPMERNLSELASFSEHIDGLGLRPGSVLLDYTEYDAGDLRRPTSAFELDSPIVVIERLRLVGGTPVGLQRLVVPGHIVRKACLSKSFVARTDFSFYGALRDAGIFLSHGEETLRAINAADNEAELLAVAAGTALIELDRHSRDSSGQLVEHVRARYLGSDYLYRVSLNKQSNGGTNETNQGANLHTNGGCADRAASLLDE